MKLLVRYIGLGLLVTILTSCSGVPVERGTTYVEPQAPGPGQAQLIIFWPNQKQVSTCCVVIKLDDEQIAYLINNTYSYKNINPGRHVIEAGKPGVTTEYVSGPSEMLELEEGKRYFVRIIDVAVNTASISMIGGVPAPYTSITGNIKLEITTEEHRWLFSTRLATEK